MNTIASPADDFNGKKPGSGYTNRAKGESNIVPNRAAKRRPFLSSYEYEHVLRAKPGDKAPKRWGGGRLGEWDPERGQN